MADKNSGQGNDFNSSSQDWERNGGRLDRENENRQNSGYAQGDADRRRQMENQEFGSQYEQENDWNRRQDNWRRGEDYNRGSQNRENDYSGRRDQGGNYGNQAGQRRSGGLYGGDTRNYGNANQGSFDRDWWDRTREKISSWFGDDDDDRKGRRDKRYAGQHRGKGPKGYNRSDTRIHEDVCDRLSDEDHLDATHIDVKVENGEVILTGTVSDREQKRRAEDVVESVSGVRDVENRIKVNRGDTAAHTTSQLGSDIS